MKFPATWRASIDVTCDPEIFAEVLDAWVKGLDIPLKEPAADAGPGFYLTDVPINRAGLAATAFMRKAGIEHPQAYLWRAMHFYEVIRNAATHGLSEHVREDAVSCALVHAAAVAKLRFDEAVSFDEAGSFDMEDVARLTREFRAAEGAD